MPRNLIYPNVDLRFDAACRFRHEGRRVSWSTDGKLFLVDVEAVSAIVFAAGFPDDLILGATEPAGEVRGIAVFESEGSPSPKAWLAEPRHQELLVEVGPQPNEQLLVARNGASLIATPRGVDADWERLDRLIRLIDALPPDQGDELAFDVQALPTELHPLAAHIPEWTIGDDVLRSERIEEASSTELSTVVEAVTPLLSTINDFIDARSEPLSDEAILLGQLAEAALEAVQELERRRE